MSDWKTFAKNNVVSRDWAEIRAQWAAASTGFQYGSVDALETAVGGYVADDFDKLPESSVFSFPGGTVPGFHDAIESALRGAYLYGNVSNCLRAGQPTWASLEAYHCSFVFCRAILGLLGISFVRIRDTNCVVDLFPIGVSKAERKKFRSQFGSYDNPARLFFRRRGALIEQSGTWALLVRALRVASLPERAEEARRVILELEDGFGRTRNDILYRNQPWPFAPDLQWPLSALNISDDIFAYGDLTDFFITNRDSNFSFCKLMIDFAAILMNEIIAGGAVSLLPSYYAPKIAEFKGFVSREINLTP